MGYRIRRRIGRARWKFIEFGMQGHSIRHGACTPGSEASPLHPDNVQHPILQISKDALILPSFSKYWRLSCQRRVSVDSCATSSTSLW